MSLVELDCTVTFGQVGSSLIFASPQVTSPTQAGSFTLAVGGIYGALLWAPDHLASVKAAIAGNQAPQAAAFAALGTASGGWSGHANNLAALAAYYQTFNGQGRLNTFACPGYYYDPTHALQIQNLVNADTSAAAMTALYGFLNNSNAPTAQAIVRAWTTTITAISQAANPAGDPANDAPLIACTAFNAFMLAAILLDEGLHGGWSNSSGWTQADRTNVETWVQNVLYPCTQVICNPFTTGAPASGMPNNWRSWAIYEWSLCAFYLLGSTNPSTLALGNSMLTGVAAALVNAISGTIPESGPITNPPTGTYTNAIVRSTMTYTGVNPAVVMQPGELFAEDLRGNDAVHYNYFSLLPMCAAAQVILAAGGPNYFQTDQSLLQLALTQELSRLSPLQSGQNSDLPFTPELYEAMGQIYSSTAYTGYASPLRPVMPNSSGVMQHVSPFFAATLTNGGAADLVSWDFHDGTWGPLDHTNFIGDGQIVADATAPAGFSAQWTWTSSSTDEGGQVNAIFPSRQTAYVRFGYKQDPNFPNGGIKKILRFRASGYNQLLGTLDIDADQYIWFYDVLDSVNVYYQTAGPSPSSLRGSWHWFEVYNDISQSGNLVFKVWLDGTLIISGTDAVSNQGLSFGIASPGGTFNAPAGQGTDWITSIAVSTSYIGAPW